MLESTLFKLDVGTGVCKGATLQKGVEKRVPRETLPTRTGAGRAGHSPSARGFMCGQPGVEAGGMEAWGRPPGKQSVEGDGLWWLTVLSPRWTLLRPQASPRLGSDLSTAGTAAEHAPDSEKTLLPASLQLIPGTSGGDTGLAHTSWSSHCVNH